jgi:hypothetical protein
MMSSRPATPLAGSFESSQRLSTDLGVSLDSSISILEQWMASDAASILSYDVAGRVRGAGGANNRHFIGVDAFVRDLPLAR